MIRLKEDTLEILSYTKTNVNPLEIVSVANNRNVSINLRDAFPFPYSKKDAESWIEYASSKPETSFHIRVDGKFAGGIALMRKNDIHSRTFELGYWLGETYWGKGLMSRAVKLVLCYAYESERINPLRIEAVVKTKHLGSRRVLEKNGFVFEGTLRSSAVKEGVIYDMAMYSVIKSDITSTPSSSSKIGGGAVVGTAVLATMLLLFLYTRRKKLGIR